MNRLSVTIILFIIIAALSAGYCIAQSDEDGPTKAEDIETETNSNSSDIDDDGLTDAEELEIGTDPENPDTDGDGLKDGAEVIGSLGFKTDPLNNDTDHDGLEDLREIWWACDPTDAYTNDIGEPDGKQVNEKSSYPYADIGSKDTDGDGLPYGAEVYEIGTDPKSRSTDGDRYSDGMEYFHHQNGVDLPGYVDRDPFIPSTPDIGISVDPNVKLDLAQEVTVGSKNIRSGEQSTSTESSTGISTSLGVSTEISSQVDVGYPPWKSSVSTTAKATLSAAIEATATLSTSEESRYATLSEWERAEYIDLSGSKLRTTVKIKNIGNDMLTSQIDELLLNVYLGSDNVPFYTWQLSEHTTKINNLKPGDEASFVIEIPIDFNQYSRFDSGEALTIAVNHYSFGEDQQWLENAKSKCAIIDVDYGGGKYNRHYIAISSENNITLYDAYNTFGDMVLSHDDKYIQSIDDREIITGYPPYKWWSINFQNREQKDIPANFTTTVLHPGDHLLLEYEVDTDGDHLSDKTEMLLGTDKNVIDTDKDGLPDGYEVLDYHTDPRLFDTDGDGNADGTNMGVVFGGAKNDNGYSVQETSDGGYIIAGSTESYGAGEEDVWLIKTNSSGHEMWNKTFGGTEYDYGYAVRETTDGGYVVTGSKWSYDEGGAWLIKTDPAGNEMWNKIFGRKYCEGRGYAVQETSDGGYVITGSTKLNNTEFIVNVWLIKTDSYGNEMWNKTFGGAWNIELHDIGYSVQETRDGGYIIAGETGSYGAGISRDGYGNRNVWLIKTNSSGYEMWNKTFGGTSGDRGFSVQETSDGGYVIAGETGSYGAGGIDVWLIKTNSSGHEMWNKTFGGTEYDYGYAVRETTDGGYVVTGYTNSYGAGGIDVWLIKTNSSGYEMWNKTFGGTGDEEGRCVQVTNDGRYVIAGSSSKGAGGTDVLLIKTDPLLMEYMHDLANIG
jgi:hypothetical protein